MPKTEKVKGRKISSMRIFVIYLIPFIVVLVLFPYKDKTLLNNQYPFSAKFTDKDIDFELGFMPIPVTIPAYIKPPLLSAIGIPQGLFVYQTCIYHLSSFVIQNKKILSDAVLLDVRVKFDSQTIHLEPNSKLCLPSERTVPPEIFVGDAISDGNKLAPLLNQNEDNPIHGESEVSIKEEPVYGKIDMFFGVLFTFYPLYWAALIAWFTVHKFVYKNLDDQS